MKKVYFVIFTCFALNLFSQAYQFPEKFNPVYNFKPDEAYKLLSENRDKSISLQQFNDYVVNYIYNNQFGFDNNRVYLNWNVPENYMIKLLDTIFPKNYNRKNLDIFITRETDLNASCSRYGLVFCNIGLLNEAKSESFLGMVLLHEIAHYLFKHSLKQAELSNILFSDQRFYTDNVQAQFAKIQKQEYEADTFALNHMGKIGCELKSFSDYYEMADMKSRAYRYSASYSSMLKASNMSKSNIQLRKLKSKNNYSSHPSNIERFEASQKIMRKFPNNYKRYIFDSTLFLNVKKMAHQEVKRIQFEKSEYNNALNTCFIDYLFDPTNVKNIYYIIECLRRSMYAKPELEKTPFLTENIYNEDLFYARQSVLYKPELFLDDYDQFEKLKSHPFLSSNKKPFNTYKEAFYFFVARAKNYNLNEANFSMGLYYFAHQQLDSCKKYIGAYIENGGGINTDFAKSMLANGRPYYAGKKTLFLYDNIGNYTGYDFNYYLTKKRKKYNPLIRQNLGKDSANTNLVILNEMLANNPNLLNQYQKIENAISTLYSESDVDTYRKLRISSKESMEERSLSNIFSKNLLIYSPECYKWCAENNYGTIFFVDAVYQYKDYMIEDEYYNNYTGYYLNFGALRPYMKDAVRGFTRKQKEEEIHADLNDFLFGTQ